MATNKMTGILAVLLAITIIGGTLGYLGIIREKSEIGKALNVEMSMEQAVREVEVSIWETANSIFYYMLEPSAVSLEEYKKQLKDVEEFMTRYKALIDTEEEKSMVVEFEKAWTDSVSKAEALLKLRDKMKGLHEKTWDAVHEADDVIDYKIQPIFIEGLTDLIAKEKAVREVEASIWEAINAINYYSYRQSDKSKREYHSQLKDVDEFWEKYKKLNITPSEEGHINEFEDKWDRSVELMNECHVLADELKEKYNTFWNSIHEADDVIDFDIQVNLEKKDKR